MPEGWSRQWSDLVIYQLGNSSPPVWSERILLHSGWTKWSWVADNLHQRLCSSAQSEVGGKGVRMSSCGAASPNRGWRGFPAESERWPRGNRKGLAVANLLEIYYELIVVPGETNWSREVSPRLFSTANSACAIYASCILSQGLCLPSLFRMYLTGFSDHGASDRTTLGSESNYLMSASGWQAIVVFKVYLG